MEDLKNIAPKIIEQLLGISKNIRIEIITFESNAKKLQGLTNNYNDIKNAINNMYTYGGTYPSYALDIINNELEEDKSNFIFILTDGDISDKNKTTTLLEELKSKNVQICAIRIGSVGSDNTIKEHAQSYYESNNLTDDKLQEAISTFITDVKESITIEEKTLDFSDNYYINSNSKKYLNYTSTYYYKALDAVNNSGEFVKNAEALINNESGIAKAVENSIQTISSLAANNNQAEIKNEGPTFYFMARPTYSLKPSIKATKAMLYSSRGQKLFDNILSDETVYETLEQEDLYGSRVYINYEIEVKNESTSPNKTDSIWLISYMPDYLDITEHPILYGIKDGNVTQIDALNIKTIKIDADNLNNQYSEIKDKYISDEVYNYLKKTGHSAVIFNINLKDSGFELSKDASICISYIANRILNTEDEMSYTGFVEILRYTNNNYRRLQYNDSDNVAVGNNMPKVENLEKDNAQSNNITILTPTGGNRSKRKIIYLLIVLLIVLVILLIIIKTKKKTIEKNVKL